MTVYNSLTGNSVRELVVGDKNEDGSYDIAICLEDPVDLTLPSITLFAGEINPITMQEYGTDKSRLLGDPTVSGVA